MTRSRARKVRNFAFDAQQWKGRFQAHADGESQFGDAEDRGERLIGQMFVNPE